MLSGLKRLPARIPRAGALFLALALFAALPLGGCATPVAETPAQTVFAVQADLQAAQRAALVYLRSPVATSAGKVIVKRLEATAVDAVQAAQDAVRNGDTPAVPALIATAHGAVAALFAHTNGEDAR